MKLTTKQLKQIIAEELQGLLESEYSESGQHNIDIKMIKILTTVERDPLMAAQLYNQLEPHEKWDTNRMYNAAMQWSYRIRMGMHDTNARWRRTYDSPADWPETIDDQGPDDWDWPEAMDARESLRTFSKAIGGKAK